MVRNMTAVWEEIHGFNSPGEFKRFCTYIEGQVSSGLAIERAPDPNYEKAMIFGGRWFEDVETREIWRLVSPDFPFRGLWEKVEQASR
jgi:hypothetical protein